MQGNRARDIIKLKEKPFPAWLAAMSATIGVYEYSTVQIIYSVKISAEDIDKTAGSIQTHINRTFTETDHANPSAEMLAIACGTPKTEEGNKNEAEQNNTGATDTLDASASTSGAVEPERNGDDSATGSVETTSQVERSGPFYFLLADGEKVGRANKMPGLEKALADGGKEISQDEYQARKNGTFTPEIADLTDPDEETGKRLAAGRGEYVDGINDPDDPKWVGGRGERNNSENKTTGAESEQAARVCPQYAPENKNI